MTIDSGIIPVIIRNSTSEKRPRAGCSKVAVKDLVLLEEVQQSKVMLNIGG